MLFNISMKLIKDIGIEHKAGCKRGERYGLFECPHCKLIVKRIMKNGKSQKVCSHKCYAETRNKRGPYKKKIISKKYVYIYMPDHPHAVGTKKLYVAEHRLILEQILGRYLTKDEVPHHIDGNTLNNEPSNLILMTISEHNSHHAALRRRDNGKFKT